MGNTATKDKAEHVDGGALLPNGIYTGPQDYDFRIVQRLILQRKLAPFYKGLEECADSEDAQEELKEKLLRAAATSPSLLSSASAPGKRPLSASAVPSSSSSQPHSTHNYSESERERELRRLYHGAIECPICFLYYPRNINRTRCCDKPMCTECFVQLKRLESAPTESPACPYCVEPHFGVIYSCTPHPTDLHPLTGQTQHAGGTSMSVSSSSNSMERAPDQSPSSPSSRRRSTSHKSPDVVAADDLRPDWNRRILAAAQRQPGSRRASTSSSVSGATFALGRRLAAGRSSGSNSRRSNSSAAAADYNGYLAAVRNMGTDLEELMMMEAMRQSLQDEQDRINRESAAATAAAAAASSAQQVANTTASPSTSSAGAASSSTTVSSDRQLSSSASTANSSTAQGVAVMLGDDEYDQDSLISDDEDSDEDTPAQLQNRAIRYRNIAGSRSGQMPVDLSPKHRVEETANPTEAL
ncbi:hypothetical protein EMPS_09264 [Entomortierella parvispora]|uniref:RING-type domain-containing protein n=1 Tax=Entomortierella parvispora TaxID=205924 RepID=A0A9P3HHP9_9FUNG|nr:hypothetical protein EMPS_09264 [Entomortierella parvispora]